MGANFWKIGDIAILIRENRDHEKVEVRGNQAGLASIRILPRGSIESADPARLFHPSVLDSDNLFELAFAAIEQRQFLSHAARLTKRRASEINMSIYEDETRGRVISIRAGGSKEACFIPSGLLLRFTVTNSRISPESPLRDLFESNLAEFVMFFWKFRDRFPTGEFRIWGDQYGSDVEFVG